MTRVVDVSTHGRRVTLDRGFLVVSDDDGECGRVPLDDISALVLSAYGTSCTTPVVVALAERGAIVVTCGKNHLPVAWTLPVSGHHAQTRIFSAQIDASKPLRKRLWQYVVQSKIAAQSAVLANRLYLLPFIDEVKPGDPTNAEGRAAAAYWPVLMGVGFRRDRDASGVNSVLNYGYTVLRAAVARAIVASGMHPGVSLQHRRDPLALADDLMEPFRPVVDAWVIKTSATEVDKPTRAALVELLGGGVEQDILRFVRFIANAFVTETLPIWRVDDNVLSHRHVRPADDERAGAEDNNPIPERSSGPRLREDAILDLHSEVSGSAGDNDESGEKTVAK